MFSLAWFQYDFSICRWQLWGNTGPWSFIFYPSKQTDPLPLFRLCQQASAWERASLGLRRFSGAAQVTLNPAKGALCIVEESLTPKKGQFLSFPVSVSVSVWAGVLEVLTTWATAEEQAPPHTPVDVRVLRARPCTTALRDNACAGDRAESSREPLEHHSWHCWMSWELRGLELCWLQHTAHPQCWCKDPDTYTHTGPSLSV